MLPFEVRRRATSSDLGVSDVDAAVRWCERALGAHPWGLGTNVDVLGNLLRLRTSREGDGRAPASSVRVFVSDVAGLVAGATDAGATGGDPAVWEERAPWGTHQRGAFTDPFGLSWDVSDLGPLRWHGPHRTHHMGYIEAVRARLAVAGVETEGIHDLSTDLALRPGESAPVEGGKRAARIDLDDVMVWDRFDWADEAALAWDEEFGWTLNITHEPGAMRGTVHDRFRLDLDMVAEPEDVARATTAVFEPDSRGPGLTARRRRHASEHDSQVEARLATHTSSLRRR